MGRRFRRGKGVPTLPKVQFQEGQGLSATVDGINAVTAAFITDPEFAGAAAITQLTFRSAAAGKNYSAVLEADIVINVHFAMGVLTDRHRRGTAAVPQRGK